MSAISDTKKIFRNFFQIFWRQNERNARILGAKSDQDAATLGHGGKLPKWQILPLRYSCDVSTKEDLLLMLFVPTDICKFDSCEKVGVSS